MSLKDKIMKIPLRDLLNLKTIADMIRPFYINDPYAKIISKNIFDAGLSLCGFFRNKKGCLILFGEDEYSYLQRLEAKQRYDKLQEFVYDQECAGIIFLKDCIPDEIRAVPLKDKNCNILFSCLDREKTKTIISEILEETLAPVIKKHGVLMDIYGVGVFLTGESGIGKSELALDLISRGHRLVADNIVEIRKIRFDKLRGQSPLELRGCILIKGLGIVNVHKLFGIISTRTVKRIEMVINLILNDDFSSKEYFGAEDSFIEYFDVQLPQRTIPVARGRDMAKIIEVATRDYMMRRKGIIPSHDYEHQRQDLLQDIYNELKG